MCGCCLDKRLSMFWLYHTIFLYQNNFKVYVLSIQNKVYDKSFRSFQTFILITFLNQIKRCTSAKCQRKCSNLASGVCYKNIIWQFQSSFYCCSGITLYIPHIKYHNEVKVFLNF